MSFDLVLKPCCDGCGSTSDLYGSNCKHTTLCLSCGKTMAANRCRCHLCGAFITKLIREYNVRASANIDKAFYIGRFVTGLPPFSKKSSENRWSLHKEGLQGRQLTDTLRDKYKNKPWILEDETGQHQFQGQIEGSQSTTATYYLLMMHGKEFLAFPAGSWYNFSKIAQYKQLTLEEAEEKMNKRRHNATGYERWMMKAATNGAAAFGEIKKNEDASKGEADGSSRLKKGKSSDDGEHSDKGEENEDEEEARKNRLGLSKKGVDDDEEGAKGGEFDLDDDDIEKGDDWEHEETFTDDDEAVGNDPEEREDLAPEIPAPPEIKQDDEEEDEEDGGLSKSGKELKKLLGRAAGLNESDGEEEEDDDDDDEIGMSPVLAPKQKDAPKDEPTENTPSKAAPPSGSARSTPTTSKSSKAKRKPGSDDVKSNNGLPVKKMKDNSSAKDEPPTSSKSNIPSKPSPATTSRPGSTPSTAPVTEDEIRTVLLSATPLTTQDLVAKFKARLKSQEDKNAFADILRRISKIQKANGPELKEMIGSGIFAVNNDDVQLESENSFLTSSYGTYSHKDQFCFNGNGTILPEKPMLLAGVAKQRELSGTLLSESEPRLKKRLSDAKSRELSGHDIFAGPREVPLRPLAAQYLELNDKGLGRTTPRKSPLTVNVAQRTAGPNNFLFGDEIPVRTSKKMHAKKIADLTGNDIFKDVAPPGFSEKTRSKAKLKELIGNDIFADKKDPPRYYFGGIRKPPGGESSITLA
ncbi:Transcription initiation factor IIF subunit alpha [Musa troglodytarum]|uniref:Transcription initiation factor IIF subunit alpha n=1 Tax=Musa troglodytarum TaxID=320322 RepID=A0A9E7ESA9_9LILI|nr:Transcription initiation factor IIF subunit alpha [Musa troglodytarum]